MSLVTGLLIGLTIMVVGAIAMGGFALYRVHRQHAESKHDHHHHA